MSTNIKSLTMENSTILRDIADYDINAPISVSISFEDDSDERPIKTEIETNDYQENQETTNSAFIPIFEPKTEIGANTIAPCMLTEEQTNEFTAHDNFQDTPGFQPESIGDIKRKRKSVEIQISKPKQRKSVSGILDNNNCDGVISSQTFASHTKENNIQVVSSASENEKNTTLIDSNLPNVGPIDNKSDPNLDCNGLQETDINKINAYVINSLASLSENMRRIMQAYGAYKRQQISKEDFVKVKLLHFKSSYKTVVTILVPEENNNDLISTFLKDTLRRARKTSGSYFMHTYRDYANLLFEMIAWTKYQQQQAQKPFGKSEPIKPAAELPGQNSVTNEPQVNKNPAQGKLQVSNSNTEGNKVCLFSSGPPKRALSINIDPHLNKYLQMTNQNHAGANSPLGGSIENENDHTRQGKTAVECLARFVANNNTPTHQSVIQPTRAQIPNVVTNHPSQHPMLPLNSSSNSMKNLSDPSIPSQQMRDRTPVLRAQLWKPPLQSQLIQPVELQRPPPRYEHPRQYPLHTQQVTPPPPPYDQSRHLRTQSCPQQQIPPQYNQVPVLQTQSTTAQFQQSQYLQAQVGQQYVQPQQLQSQLAQSHLPVPEYNQSRQPQMGLSQEGPQQYQQQPQTTEHWPSLVDLLSTVSTTPIPCPSNDQTQSGLSGQWPSQDEQPQIQPMSAHRTEWQQGLITGQLPQQTQKGAPRSASTDSGFISPLNFNASTDQTMPTMPQEPESTLPMIVHVTSLSDKASYLELGKCVVCKKSTKQMCMGCMKIYYCNYECQSVDWAAHAPNCTQQTTINL